MNDNNRHSNRTSLKAWIRQRLISGNPCFSLQEVVGALSHLSRKVLVVALARLKAKRLLYSPVKEFYVAMPDRYQLRGEIPPSYYVHDLMRHLGRDYYLGLASAAALWGAGHQRIQRDFVVITGERKKRRLAASGMIEWIFRHTLPEQFVVTRNTDGGVARFSNPMLTAFDLVRNAHACGGMANVALMLAEMADEEPIDFSRARELEGFFPSATWQRLGFLCERVLGCSAMGERLHDIWRTLDMCSVCVPLTPNESGRSGDMDSRWKVVVNIDLEGEEL